MPLLSREALLQPVSVPTEDVPVPEFGPDAIVRLRGMTAGQRTRFEQQFQGKNGKSRNLQELRERLLVQTVVDEEGKQLLSNEDVQALSSQSAIVTERLVNVAMRLCGMTDNDVESLVGN